MVMGSGHKQSQQCRDMHAARVQYVAVFNPFKAKGCTFPIYGEELENIEAFQYLGCLVLADNDNTQVIRGNLKKVQRSWARLSRVLRAENASALLCGMF